MQVSGAGAGPRGPQNLPPQAAVNRPQRSEASPPTGPASPITPSGGHHPPAHGLRRLMAAGHFAEGSSAYTAHAAKLGLPASALATDETPTNEIPTGETPVEGIVVEGPVIEGPVIEEVLVQEATLDERAAPADDPAQPALLDLDALLMEELIAEQDEPPSLLETLAETVEEAPSPLLAEIVIDTTEDDPTLLEEIVESIEENVEQPSA